MRALKRLSHRDWLTLRDLWISHLPVIDLEARYPEPTLWQLPTIHVPPLNAGGTAEFFYVPGVREAIFREAVLLTRKFIYCGTVLASLAEDGKNTWTAVAAYEACFYAAKAFMCLLGFASFGRNSNIYLDVFCETERRVGKEKKKFHETIRAHKLHERLTHEMLWAVTQRLIDTTRFEGALGELQIELKILDWDRFSNFRNKILYDGGFWPLHGDVAMCDLAKAIHNPEVIRAAQLERGNSSPPFAGEYFVMASVLQNLIAGMFQSIAEIAPAMASEVRAFDVLRPLAA